MDCRNMCQRLEPYLDGELARDEARALETHLETCTDCRAALGRLEALRQGLRDPALRRTAPQALRERLLATRPVRTGVSRVPRRAPPWLQLAAACACTFVLGGASVQWWASRHEVTGERVQLERDLFDAHLRSLAAASPVDVVSSDHHTVKPWFAGKLAQSPQVRDFADAGFTLLGGRIDYLGGERVAVLVYRHGQHLLDVFVLPMHAPTLPGEQAANGYSADAVMLGGQPAVVVSDLDADERARFVRLLAAP